MQSTNSRSRKGAAALAAVLMILVGAEGAQAQDAQAVVSMVETAMAEFETPNGPVIELDSRFECADPRDQEPVVCPRPDVEAFLAEYASELGVNLVSEGSSIPPCRWNEGEATRDKGVRMSVNMNRDQDGVVWMSVGVRCEQAADRMAQGFVHAVRYPFRLEDGNWKRNGEAIVIIS